MFGVIVDDVFFQTSVVKGDLPRIYDLRFFLVNLYAISMLQMLKIRHHVTLFSQFNSTMGSLLQLYTVPVQCQTSDADLLLENTSY